MNNKRIQEIIFDVSMIYFDLSENSFLSPERNHPIGAGSTCTYFDAWINRPGVDRFTRRNSQPKKDQVEGSMVH